MKLLSLLFFITTLNVLAQDASVYLNNFDNKVYSVKSKGVKDLSVEVESSRLTKLANDQMIFGKLKSLKFQVYWTSSPEKLAIEVKGLPEGFREIKEELKANILPMIEYILPPTVVQRFPGYKANLNQKDREVILKDSTGIALIPQFSLKFDNQDKLTEVIGNKEVGKLFTSFNYEKAQFSGGLWVLTGRQTISSDNGQTITTKNDLTYKDFNGISAVNHVSISVEQKSDEPGAKALNFKEEVEFSQYKMNTGEAFNYFLGESSK